MTPDEPTKAVLDYERPRRKRRGFSMEIISIIGSIVVGGLSTLFVGMILVAAALEEIRHGHWWFIAVPILGVLIRGAFYIRPLRDKLQRKKWDRRERAGLCVICGYDLRGTPQKCPECGIDSIKLYGERLHRELWPEEGATTKDEISDKD